MLATPHKTWRRDGFWGEVLTLRFRFPDASAARAAAEALVASHARGEAVVITLSSGENDMGILQ